MTSERRVRKQVEYMVADHTKVGVGSLQKGHIPHQTSVSRDRERLEKFNSKYMIVIGVVMLVS